MFTGPLDRPPFFRLPHAGPPISGSIGSQTLLPTRQTRRTQAAPPRYSRNQVFFGRHACCPRAAQCSHRSPTTALRALRPARPAFGRLPANGVLTFASIWQLPGPELRGLRGWPKRASLPGLFSLPGCHCFFGSITLFYCCAAHAPQPLCASLICALHFGELVGFLFSLAHFFSVFSCLCVHRG